MGTFTNSEDPDEMPHFILFVKVYKKALLAKQSAETRSDRDKLCHFWSKMKSQESRNKLFFS